MPASDATKETDGLLRAPAARPESTSAPRRARPIYRVFVSSTWLDLQPERRALMEALNRMEEMRFVGMEFFGNRPDDTHDASIDQVDVCEVFVGIIGYRYGSGITEAEYRRARELGLPCFVYFKREADVRPELTDGDPALAAKLAAFKQDLLRGHTVKEFASPEELAANATADLHNWVAARWISLEQATPIDSRVPVAPPDAERTNVLRLLERIQHDWIEGVLEASLHHRAWLELGLDWKEDAVEHPWDRILVAPNRPIQTLNAEDSIAGVFDKAQNTLLVLGEPGAGKTTTLLELARELIARARRSVHEPAPVVLALSTWTGEQRDFSAWLVAELGLRYQVPKKLARAWLDDSRLVLLLDGLDEVGEEHREACVGAINAFAEAHQPPGLAVTCRVAEYDALAVKLRLRAAICLQPLTPAQVKRYFAAAGAGLEPLRQAMRNDVGLRELARTPLMLSVMTMAWRDAPTEGVTGPVGETVEERRRQLFEAYVTAATHRRGKATAGYSAAQTVGWLSWLAQRMKQHGHTLFAVEQLQPGWLGGVRQQFGYFLVTRLLGAVALALPFLPWDVPLRARLLVLLLSVIVGAIFGAVDFGFARFDWGGAKRATNRFHALFFTTLMGGVGWMAAVSALEGGGKRPWSLILSVVYLLMAGFAFCVPLDVRALDVKPTAEMRWSWRQAIAFGVKGLVAMNIAIATVFVAVVVFAVAETGWSKTTADLFGNRPYLYGLVSTAGLVAFGWVRWRPAATFQNLALAATVLLMGGLMGEALSVPNDIGKWAFLLMVITPGIALGVFGGFASTMVDPTRARNRGPWFWLRVPVMMFFIVGLLMLIPGIVWIVSDWGAVSSNGSNNEIKMVLTQGAAGGLVGFFRFGGFNGVQHFLLRWLLGRSGHLPPKAEAFFDHCAQLALMQKVGLGYRFIHALLLDHLAARPAPATTRDAASLGGG